MWYEWKTGVPLEVAVPLPNDKGGAPVRAAAGAGVLTGTGRLTLLLLGFIVLVGLVLRSCRLAERPLWYDEAFSWRLTQFSWPEMLQRGTWDAHPPLYYVVLKAWCGFFGTSTLALRSLSVLMGVVTILGMYLFTSRTARTPRQGPAEPGQLPKANAGLGLLVAALVAVSVFQIRWSWETRMYSLATALLALSSWALFRALQAGPKSWRPWVGYGVVTLLLAYTHYYAVFSIVGQVLFVLAYLLVRARRQALGGARAPPVRGLLLAYGILIIGWLPWLPYFLRQREQVQADYWIGTEAWRLHGAAVCYQMFVEPEGPAFVPLLVVLLSLSVCTLGLTFLAWKGGAVERYVVTMAVCPFVLSVLASMSGTGVFHVRYFLLAHLFFLVALGMLVWRIRSRWARAAVVVALLANGLYIYSSFVGDYMTPEKPGARGACEYLARRRAPGDPVVVTSPQVYVSVLYYFPEPELVRVYYGGHRIPHYEGAAILTPEDVLSDEQLLGIHARTIWVIDAIGEKKFSVPPPESWTEKGRHTFPQAYGGGPVLVTQYEVPENVTRAGSLDP
jgi:mannosyltransferase